MDLGKKEILKNIEKAISSDTEHKPSYRTCLIAGLCSKNFTTGSDTEKIIENDMLYYNVSDMNFAVALRNSLDVQSLDQVSDDDNLTYVINHKKEEEPLSVMNQEIWNFLDASKELVCEIKKLVKERETKGSRSGIIHLFEEDLKTEITELVQQAGSQVRRNIENIQMKKNTVFCSETGELKINTQIFMGSKMELEIMDIGPYKDGKIAVISGINEDGSIFSFTDTEYSENKSLYKIGEKFRFELAAIAYDSRRINPEKTPVGVTMRGVLKNAPDSALAAFFAGTIRKTAFCGQNFYIFNILPDIMSREISSTPCYLRETVNFNSLKEGEAIAAVVWFCGRFCR